MKEPSFWLVNNKITRGPRTINHYYDYREVDGIKFPFLWVQTNEKLAQMHVFVVESIQLLARAGADVNTTNARGETPLLAAGQRGH